MSSVVYVCIYICNNITFESLDVESAFLFIQHLKGTRVKFVSEYHRVKVKVT